MRFILYFFILFFSIQPSYADTKFLTISDIHFGNDNQPQDGNDTGETLLASAMKKYSQLTSQVDFILTLGDFPTHMLITTPKKADYLKTVFHDLYQGDKADKPLFYITGNNDSLQGNYQPFSTNGISPLTMAKEWQGACAHCEGLIIDGTHLREKGYYASYVLPGNKDIILIALNSVQFAKLPFLASHYPNQNKDAQQQLKWLEMQLKTNQAKQLLLALHIPPGNSYKGSPFWQETYLKKFIELLNQTHQRYGQITLLTAHTHMDDIRKIHLTDGTNIYAYATPSISQIHHNYPAMKIFELGDNMLVKDYTTYYTTTDKEWNNKHYTALKDIFPQCADSMLDNCMDKLSNAMVCNSLKDGRFYSAKGPKVDSSVCGITYPVN